MGDVGDEDGDVLFGAQRDGRAGPRGSGEPRGAVVGDPYALEEGDGRGEVARGEAVLEGGELEQFTPRRRGGLRGPVPVPRGVAYEGGGAGERVVPAGGVLDDGGEDPALVGEEQVPLAEVRVPQHLDGVGDVQPLPGAAGRVEEQMGAGVAGDVGKPQLGAAGEDLVGVAAARHGLCPHDVLGGDAGGRRRPVARGDGRHGLDLTALLGAGVVARAVRRRGR